MIDLYEKTLFDIKNTLLSSSTIRKLLVNDSNNAIDERDVSIDEADSYITFFQTINIKLNENQNCYINVYFQDITKEYEEKYDGTLIINFYCSNDKLILLKNKIRTLTAAKHIKDLINEKKFSLSNKFKFVSMNNVILDENICGVRLFFDATTGNNK